MICMRAVPILNLLRGGAVAIASPFPSASTSWWNLIPNLGKVCSLNVRNLFSRVAKQAVMGYEGAMSAMRTIAIASGLAGRALLGLLLSCP